MNNLSIVIPVFNEEKRIQKTFEALKGLQLPHGLKLKEVIFVNDGSTDTTLKLIKAFSVVQKKQSIKVLSYIENMGKGYAVKLGMLRSTGDYALLCDADMSTPFSELSKFVPIIKRDYEVIIGTRKNGASTVTVHQPFIRELMGKGFTLFTKTALQLDVTDFTCGFKLFSRYSINVIFKQAKINRWGYDAEIIYLAHKEKLPMKECPVDWADVKNSHVKLTQAVFGTTYEIGKIILLHSSIGKFDVIRAGNYLISPASRIASYFI